VLKNAGATAPKRDIQDERIINQIKTNSFKFGTNGIIDNVEQVGGYPVLKSTAPLKDSDGDGIPDEWEIAHRLNPNDRSDATKSDLANGYTHIEEYINSLIVSLY